MLNFLSFLCSPSEKPFTYGAWRTSKNSFWFTVLTSCSTPLRMAFNVSVVQDLSKVSLTNFSGYPFATKTFFNNVSSSTKSSCLSHSMWARWISPFITPSNMFFGWFESQFMYCWVCVGFLYTLVTNLSSSFVIPTSKKGIKLFSSCLSVNWILLSIPFRRQTKFSNSSFPCLQIMKISSISLFQ